MAGTREGGKLAAATNKQRYGDQFYAMIGRRGGQVSRGGGFTHRPEMARKYGSAGGKQSAKVRWGWRKDILSLDQIDVLVKLASGPKTLPELRVSRTTARTVKRLLERGYVALTEDWYSLTEKGTAVAAEHQPTRLSFFDWYKTMWALSLTYATQEQLHWLLINHVLFGVKLG